MALIPDGAGIFSLDCSGVAATEEIVSSSPAGIGPGAFNRTLLEFAGSISSGDVLATFK
jgi:hypothetical protein